MVRSLTATLALLSAVGLAQKVVDLKVGVPVINTVGANEYNQYQFDMGSAHFKAHQPVQFSLTLIAGDPDMFATTGGYRPTSGAGNYMWRSAGLNNETILVPPTDKNYNQQWNISVLGWLEPAIYRLEAIFPSGPNYTQPLTYNEEQSGEAQNHNFSYFEIQSPNPQEDLVFTVTPLTGATGLYISKYATGYKAKFPAVVCKQWSGSTGHCVEWMVDPESFDYANVNEAGADRIELKKAEYTTHDSFIVGVYALPNAGYPASFIVLASKNDVPTSLPLGIETWADVPDWQYIYYTVEFVFNSSAKPALTITTSNFWGSTQIYVNEGSNKPSNTSSDWKTTTTTYWESQVHLAFSDLNSKCTNGQACHLTLAVQGTGTLGDSGFYIAASMSNDASNPTYLTLGENVDGNVAAGAYDFYNLNVDTSVDEAVSISVSLGAGDVDVYVTIGNDAQFYPAQKEDYYKYIYSGTDTITIEPGSGMLRVTKDELLQHPCLDELNYRQVEPGVKVGRDARVYSRVHVDALHHYAAVLATDATGFGSTRACPPPPTEIIMRERRAAEVRRFKVHGPPLGEHPKRVTIPVAELVGDSKYCNHCSFKVSIKGGLSGAVYSLSTSATGSSVTPLPAGQPVGGFTKSGNYTYFSFDVLEAAGGGSPDIFISVTAETGDPDMFVSVQDPSRPDHLPTSNDFTWASMAVGQELLHIAPTDDHYCAQAATCTLLVGIHAFGWQDASFSVTAWVENSAGPPDIVELLNGEQQGGWVRNGGDDLHDNYMFFSFLSSPSVPSEIGVTLSWMATLGSVDVFVTNKYDPQNPDLSKLPTAQNTDSDMWRVTDGSESLTISSSDSGFNKNTAYYVIGVHGTDTSLTWTAFDMTAVAGSTAEQLSPGTPSRGHQVSAGTNVNFQLDLGALSRDLVIQVTPTGGSLYLAVTSDQSDPTVWPTCTGSWGTIKCEHTMWLADTSASQNLNISHIQPCGSQPGVTVSNCTGVQSAWHTGQWRLTAYAMTDATFDIVFELGDDHVNLFDGEPQAGQTSDEIICAPDDRNPDTQVCDTSDPSKTFHKYVQWFRAVQPSYVSGDAAITVSRRCDNTTGICGPPLTVYVQSCADVPAAAGGCSVGDLFPYSGHNSFQVAIASDQLQGIVTVPAKSCNPGAGQDCDIFVGVFSTCAGLGCQPGPFDIVFNLEGSGTVQEISSTCFAAGETCVIPSTPTGPNYVNFFSASTKSLIFASTVDVRLESCGSSYDLYVCEPGPNTACTKQGPDHPSKGNSDHDAQTDVHGVADISFHTSELPQNQFFIGTVATGNTASLAVAQFNLNLRTGSSPVLNLPTNRQEVNLESTSSSGTTEVIMHFAPPLLDTTGGSGGTVISNATYVAYLLPVDPTTNKIFPGTVLDTACGLDNAYDVIKKTSYGSSAIRNVTGGPAPEVRFQGVTPGKYYGSVIIYCDRASKCLPTNLPNDPPIVAYWANTVTVTPAPGPNPSASPSPGHKSGKGNNNPPSGGAIAGGIIGAIAVVALGFGAFFLYRRWKNNAVPAGYADGFYSTSGGDQYESLE